MKRILTVTIDLLLIFGSIVLCYRLFREFGLIRNYTDNIGAFFVLAPFIGMLYLLLTYAFGLYHYARRKWADVAYTVFLISLSLLLGTMAMCFFIRGAALAFPRSILLLSALFYWILLTFWRMTVWKVARSRHGVKKATIVGPHAAALAGVLRKKYRDLYRVGSLHGENDEDLAGSLSDSEVVFLTHGVSDRGRERILFLSNNYRAGVFFIPEYRDLALMSASMQKTDDIPTFYIDRLGLTPEERFVKRALDLALASVGFVLALPLFLLSALLVKLDGGPVFYSQERLTRGHKVFKVHKFRSMIPNAEKLSGPVLAGEDDPRITRVGKFLRATRLDELPQLLNILKGDMSIVGPRPERPFFTEQFKAQTPQYEQRLIVKAGLTGLAQVEGKYNTSFEDKLRYDLLYISQYSLFRDVMIILQTIKILFLKDSTEGVGQPAPVENLRDRREPRRPETAAANVSGLSS